jgi:hypothetical protein
MTFQEFYSLGADKVNVIYTGPFPRDITNEKITLGKCYTLLYKGYNYIFYDDEGKTISAMPHYFAFTLVKQQT